MRNINWSKWIAIALSVFLVTQFIQVSFLAVGQIGGGQANAGADASRGSIAEEIYQGVWDKVGDGDMILSARAEGATAGVKLTDVTVDGDSVFSGSEIAFPSVEEGESITLSFDVSIRGNGGERIVYGGGSYNITLPTGLKNAATGSMSGTLTASGTKQDDGGGEVSYTDLEIGTYEVAEGGNTIIVVLNAITEDAGILAIEDMSFSVGGIQIDGDTTSETRDTTWSIPDDSGSQTVALQWGVLDDNNAQSATLQAASLPLRSPSGTAATVSKLTIQAVGVSSGSSTPLSGVVYELSADENHFASAAVNETPTGVTYTQADGKTTATWTTGSNGAVTFADILVPGGVYTLHEKTTPTGYVVARDVTITLNSSTGEATVSDGSSASVSGEVSSGQTVSISHDSDVTTVKEIARVVDKADNTAVAGAVFSLYKVSVGDTTTLVTSMTSGTDGKLALGTGVALEKNASYYLLQTGVPTGYAETNKNKSYTFKTDDTAISYTSDGTAWGDSSEGVIANDHISGTLKITRTDATAAVAANGVTYQLYKGSPSTEDGSAKVVNTDGTASFTNLEWGTSYYIKQTGGTPMDATGTYGPYVFAATESASKSASTCQAADTYTESTVTWNVTITPASAMTVSFKFVDTANAAATGSFTVTDKTSGSSMGTVSLSASSETGSLNNLLTGHTYTVTQTEASVASGMAKVSFDFTLGADGKVTAVSDTNVATADNSGTTPVITMKQKEVELSFALEICTAEQGYSTVSDDEETVPGAGFKFALYASGSSTALKSLTTDSNGEASTTGLSDGTYTVKCTSAPSSGATQVDVDKKSTFTITMSNGAVSSITGDGAGDWTVNNGKIRAYLKQGSVKITAKSDKTFYLYRLTWGSGSDDEREVNKIAGTVPDDIKSASKGSTYVTVVDAGSSLKKGLESLKSFLVPKALAADTNKIDYGGFTWQLLGSKKPGSGSSETFDGLIAGQAYLIREGDSTTVSDSDQYYLAKVTTSTKTLTSAAAATTGSSGKSTTASSSNTAKTSTGSGSGSGTANSGGRGTATGDANNLWTHLIVMLIAFDALVADLLYISRKKQPVRRG